MRFATCHLQITIELRTEVLLKQDCAKPLQCVLQSPTCKSQCNYVFQLPNHISQNRISTPRQENHDFLSTFKRNFIRKMQAAKIVKTEAFVRDFLQICTLQLQNTIRRTNPAHTNHDLARKCAQPCQCKLRKVQQETTAKRNKESRPATHKARPLHTIARSRANASSAKL